VRTSASPTHVTMVAHVQTSGGTSVVHASVHILDTPASTVSLLSVLVIYQDSLVNIGTKLLS
jgi:hypothetical protein